MNSKPEENRPIKASEERYRSLIEASLDPLVTISTEGKITDMNEALANITGVTREKLTGTDFFDYFTEPQMAREVYQVVFAKGYVADSPLTLRHKNGKLTNVLFNGSVYKDDKGKVLGAVVVARDIAEQKWAIELRIANKELAFQNDEKEKRAEELIIANKELAFQNDEKEKRAAELAIANKELAFQNNEKEKRAAELAIANKELAFQNHVKEKRAAELVIANRELAFQNDEKEKRAAELFIANKELLFQTGEKEKRAAELVIADIELDFQNKEKEKREIANKELEAFSYSVKLASQYSLSLIEASLDPLVTINTEGKITDMNQATVNITGITREKLRGTDFFDYFTEPQKAREVYQEVFAKGSVADSPLTLRHRNGKLTDVLFNGSVYKDDRGNVVGVVIVARDVTAQKLLSKYSLSLIEASLDPLVTISTEGKITDMNEATVNIIGITREKIKGTDFFDYFTEPQKAREVYQEVFAKGSVADSPLTLRHKQGKLTDVLFNGSVYKDDRGNELGVVIVARDVTAQKRFENELIEAKSTAERERQIAEAAVKSKQQFLSNMSHEIRTPMNAIIGFTKVVLKTELNEKQKEYLNAIKISGDALIVLINDILDLAKVDAGKMTFDHIPFKLAASISAMLHLFETKIQEKNLTLIKKYDNTIPEFLVGDAVRLHQIILNLVGNAVKFTSEGSITVGVRMLKEDADKATIEFAITDTGIGIPENKLGNIFDDFQQATSGTSRIYGGTGLGLAIVKQLVEPQGGTIHVKSKPGAGSTFSFVLDFKKTKAKTELEADLGVELEDGIKNVKVLVVEDIALNQLLMKTLLEEFGFEMEIAANGKLAIEKLRNNTYDIILMDLQMPEMNGFEATEHIRNELKSLIPIIALTADVTTVDVEKCKAVGMNDYISKPIDEKVLYTKIIKYLKKTEKPKNNEMEPKENAQTQAIKCTSLDYLKKLTKNNTASINEMIEVYLEETPVLVQAMKTAILKQDWESLRVAAHSILPSFSTMGMAPEFETITKTIQEYAIRLRDEPAGKAKKEILDALQELFSKTETVCALACEELRSDLHAA